MTNTLRVLLAGMLIVAMLAYSRPAAADELKTDVVETIIGIVAVTAVITVAVVYAVTRPPKNTGCAVPGPGGLTQENESDHQSFSLNGDTAGIKPGDRIKVQGKKQKANSATRGSTVLKVKRDYGTCPVMP